MIKFFIVVFIGLAVIPFIPFAYTQYVRWDASNPSDDGSTINTVLDAVTPKVPVATAKQAQDINSQVLIIDIRSDDEYKRERAAKSILVSETELWSQIGKMAPDKDRTIYIYSDTDKSSAVATRLLRNLGYTKSFYIEGGLKAWKKAGYPTEEYLY